MTEKQILEELLINGDQSPSEIAESVGCNTRKVRNNISEWEKSGLISNPVAVVDPNKVGFPVTSYHFINFQKNYDRAIDRGLRQFSQWPGTQLAMIVLGDYDVIARKVSQSHAKLDIFSTNVLSSPDEELDVEFGPQSSQVFDIETVHMTQTIRRNGINIPQESQRTDGASTESTTNLTDTEATILRHLQQDASLRNTPEDIAAEVAASQNRIKETIEKLENAGVIERYGRRIDPDAGGWYRALFAISIERGRYEEVIDELINESLITVPSIRSGLGHNWADVFLEILFYSIEDLDDITDRLRSIGGVKSSRTFLGTRSPYLDETINPKR